jgi:uncharacterized protein with GYD domain
MAKYLVTASYTAEGTKGLRKDGGTKRRDVARKAIESVNGKLDVFYFCFGETDVLLIADFPDAPSAAALSLAIGSTGAVRLSTMPLLTPEEIDKACGKKTAYKAPGV